MSTKITIPWLRPGEQVGAGDAFKSLTDFVLGPNKQYCQDCDRRRTVLNSLLTFSAPPTQPPAPQQPKQRPSDWAQMYHPANDEEQLPDGGM